MGHGCHTCGSPNSCECPGWVAFTGADKPPKKVRKDKRKIFAEEIARLFAEREGSWDDYSYKDICTLVDQAYKNTQGKK